MNFFSLTQISSSLFLYWASLYDAQDILEPFHLLFALYSKLHIQLPRNDAPNISVSAWEILFAIDGTFDLLASLPTCSHSVMADILRAHVYDPYSRLPSIFERSHCYISELSNLGPFVEYPLVALDIDISSPIQGVLTFYLRYGYLFDFQPYRKSMKFIETKVAAMKLQGFNL